MSGNEDHWGGAEPTGAAERSPPAAGSSGAQPEQVVQGLAVESLGAQPEQIVQDLVDARVDARYIPAVEDIVRTVARDSCDGDLVVVMSNGGFDNIHQRLLSALEARAS